ncbi:MAG: MFS transporter, partial [Actinobacteria bacterium]|nr:MFS transporter [Actinomycetota bacterium]
MADAEPLADTGQPLAPPTAATAAPATGIFRSLNFFNARLYFASLLLSTIGSWLQLTATSYLVYRLTGKASDLGYNVAFQFLPMLLLGTWAGSFADRYDRRKIMLVTQILLAVQAL